MQHSGPSKIHSWVELGIDPATHEYHSLATTTSNRSETTIMRLVLEAEASMHTVWSSLGGQPTRGQCFFDQWLLFTPPGTRRSEKGIKGTSKKKGYVELLSSVSTGVCPKYLLEVCYFYFLFASSEEFVCPVIRAQMLWNLQLIGKNEVK
jgi:hypothetical protein